MINRSVDQKRDWFCTIIRVSETVDSRSNQQG